MKNLYLNFAFHEKRAAIVEDGKLMELFIDNPFDSSGTGNIFFGKVVKVLPGLGAVFVDIGLSKNGYLEQGDMLSGRRERLQNNEPLPEVLRVGETMLVQITKEGSSTKGPRLTELITLPGRHIVYMPGSGYMAVSKKIQPEETREALRMFGECLLQGSEGLILRTECQTAAKSVIKEELEGLRKKWEGIQKSLTDVPSLVYTDATLLEELLRNRVLNEVDRIETDELESFKNLERNPEFSGKVFMYDGKENMFSKYGIEKQIKKALQPVAWLKSGGNIVVQETEAMTVIDVNTGKNSSRINREKAVLKTNDEAAAEIARQLKLRNISGIVMIDFLKMDQEEEKESLLSSFTKALEKDRTRTSILGFTSLGLLEMTRKKTSLPLKDRLAENCPACGGTGFVTSTETLAYRMERKLWEHRNENKKLNIKVSPSLFHYLHKTNRIQELEVMLNIKLELTVDEGLLKEGFRIEDFK
ncbi:Rne/Rng family ribonuclease [Pseudalkalibacillus caeni]|uniref:Rne/Rng family ribonuclease n=1 Tax=Exobacillus caeni TaxID=2574798 RepID=UPI00148517E5|nr:Rne/Rng family ribonuclease [Pseudalkalibacillus caeni]